MVLLDNGMVVKIIFLQPSHDKVNITGIPQKSKGGAKKKIDFFYTVWEKLLT